MNKLKSTKIALCLVAVVCLLSGCARQPGENTLMDYAPSPESEPQTELTFLGYKADAINLIAIEDALHGFMIENPDIMVNYEGIKGAAYWDAFEKRKNTGNLNDLIMVNHDQVLALSQEHKLADLSDLSTLDTFASMVQNQFTSKDGSVYFIPSCIASYGLYVNLDLLEKHGQSVPATLDELIQVCDYFVSQDIIPIIINNSYSLRQLIVAKGLYPVYQQENYEEEIQRFNSGQSDLVETIRPGVELAAMMVEHGWFDVEEALKTNATSDDLVLFAQGERPFMVTGGWASPRIKAMEPGFEFEVCPFPVLDDGSVLVIDVNTCVSISAKSENVAEAKRLIEYITQPDVLWKYCDSQSSFSPLKDNRTPSDLSLRPSAESLARGDTVIGSDYNLTLPLDSALDQCASLMLQGANVDEVIQRLSVLLGNEC